MSAEDQGTRTGRHLASHAGTLHYGIIGRSAAIEVYSVMLDYIHIIRTDISVGIFNASYMCTVPGNSVCYIIVKGVWIV